MIMETSAKILTRLDDALSDEDLEKLFFLAEIVLSRPVAVEKTDGIVAIERELEKHTGCNRNTSLKLLQRFLEIIGYIAFSRQLDPLIDQGAPGYSNLSLPKLYLYEILVLVSNNLDTKSFSRLKNRIPDSQLGANREKIKTAIQLFRKLLERQTLNIRSEKTSLDRLMEWLEDIGRLDIVQQIKDHPRPVQEEGENGRQPVNDEPPTIKPVEETRGPPQQTTSASS